MPPIDCHLKWTNREPFGLHSSLRAYFEFRARQMWTISERFVTAAILQVLSYSLAVRALISSDFPHATARVTKYFINLSRVLIVYDSTSIGAVKESYLRATQESFRNLSEAGHLTGLLWVNVAEVGSQSAFCEMLLQAADMGVEGYITIVPSVLGFLKARSYATEHSTQRLKDKLYLFLSEEESPTDVLTQEILKLYPHHLFVSTRRGSEMSELWTQKFTGSRDNSMAVHLDTFRASGGLLRNVDLYPNKLLNMQGRALEVASITYIPYIVSYSVPEGTGDVDSLDPDQPKQSVVYTGTEANIILSFCRLRNCSIKVTPYGNDNWGGVYENDTSDGMIGSVYRHETELGIGCYYNWYNELFETSIAIAKSAVPILVPAPSRYPAYMTIILPFNKLIWSLIILSIIVSSFIMHGIRYSSFYMQHGGDHSSQDFPHLSLYRLTLLRMVAIFFQQSFSQSRFDGLAARFFLSTLLLAGITLENAYSGQLKSLLTIPVLTEPVDTIKKFAATDWKWASPSSAWILSIASSDVSYEQIMSEKFEELTYDELKNASFTGHYGIGLERLHGGTYSFGDYVKDGALDQMIITKDDLYYDWSRAFAIRGWPLMDILNTHILWCLDHGLYNHWEKQLVSRFLDKRTQSIISSLASGHMQKYPPMTLSVANISGPLCALVLGYSLAFIAMVAEVSFYKLSGVWRKK